MKDSPIHLHKTNMKHSTFQNFSISWSVGVGWTAWVKALFSNLSELRVTDLCLNRSFIHMICHVFLIRFDHSNFLVRPSTSADCSWQLWLWSIRILSVEFSLYLFVRYDNVDGHFYPVMWDSLGVGDDREVGRWPWRVCQLWPGECPSRAFRADPRRCASKVDHLHVSYEFFEGAASSENNWFRGIIMQLRSFAVFFRCSSF